VRTSPRGRSGYAVVAPLRLHYLEYGEAGPTIVVVPGITSPAITWEFVSEELARARRVVTLDVRGRGLSDRASSGLYRLSDYAADLAGLVDALGLDRPALLGHSMGARIVAAFAAAYPGRAGASIVVDPPLSGPGRDPYPFPLSVYTESLREAVAGASAEDMRRYFPTWTDEQLRLRAEWLATCDETAVVQSYRSFHDEDFFDAWPKVPAPVLFLFGLESPVVPESALAEVRTANPRAEVVGIPKAGHMIPWDNLPAFLEAVRRFLDSKSRQAERRQSDVGS
jgi:N-formylmaleamate deformylase